ncbi:DUF2232 domain-containing protein [Anaerobacillus sp. HL2]|nr:DUF2232 domain-containing protein [Anaerobacillus sp. HL2]
MLGTCFRLEIIMTIQGLAVVFYYCYIKGLNKSVPIIILIITFFAPFLLIYIDLRYN